jgi:hypothetical protein
MKKIKPVTPARLVINCTPEYLDQVKEWATAEGFDSYANYVKFCISLHQAKKKDR